MWDILTTYGGYLLKGSFPAGPIGGLAMTAIISLLSYCLAFPLAVGLALMRTSGRKGLAAVAQTYTYAMRGFPLLMLVLWIYYLLPLLLGFPIGGFATMVLALVLFQAPYIAEVIRGGIEALPQGQIDAGKALGLSRWSISRKVVLPQALYNVTPGLINQFTISVKESSLGYVIALNELTFAAQQINSTLVSRSMEVYPVLAAAYFVVSYSLSYVARRLDRKISSQRSPVAA